MSFLQHLKLSDLTFIAGVFFALFILSACASDKPAPAEACAADEELSGDGDCLAQFTDEDCQAIGFNLANDDGDCIGSAPDYSFLPLPEGLAAYGTAEYNKSGILNRVKAAYAYANIDTITGAKQAGEGQIVSVAASFGFNAKHQEFTDADGNEGAAFDSVYYTSGKVEYNNAAEIVKAMDDGTITCSYSILCIGSAYAAMIAARKGDYVLAAGANTSNPNAIVTGHADYDVNAVYDANYAQMHGIAYHAKIKGFVIDSVTDAKIEDILTRGTSKDIIAMQHHWDINAKACYVNSAGVEKSYDRPMGLNRKAAGDGKCAGTVTNDPIPAAELEAWTTAVADPNKTIMVFPTGTQGINSETGLIDGNSVSALVALGSVEAANIPAFRAAFPVLDPDDSLKFGRWLTVTNIDGNNKIFDTSNGCGITMHFCLAASGDGYTTAITPGVDGYSQLAGAGATSTVSGALAVLKGAFPNMSPENLTKLVLETSSYIAMETDDETHRTQALDADGNGVTFTHSDGKTYPRYVNPVYGYGVLNLHAATTPSVVSSYVSASNNTSIGVLWKDTSLTLSSHFGGNFESVKFGIGDSYGRHFVTSAPQVSHTPIAVGLDDYMAGLFGENVQSKTLGPQARANYSNGSDGQNWMNLQYVSGKSTTKIAFQDSYKVSPLNDTGATSMLRANHIRPASSNIGMMDVDYQLGRNLTLSSYAARGEYDTGYKFDELGTDIDISHKKSTLNIGLGNIREHEQFLGTNTSGAYTLREPSISQFTDVTYGHDVGNRFNLYANYINYKTEVDMGYQDFATIDNLQADQYQIGFKGKNLLSDDDGLNVALITKLGVTDGALNQNTVLGYTEAGNFNNVTQSYDLAVQERHQQFEITYQGRLYQNADKVSALKDNRFFTTIRVDQNLNHVQGASQTEVIGGIQAKF